ncbi:ArsR family transcriptional regulator [Calothrix sp. HK-06]|nr:ArsR family transcriptional regulator [Calothrix sp. HK-06]
MPTPIAATPENIAATFHALSDPLRIRVLELLRHQEQCVCDLCTVLGATQSKLSFHLKILKEAGLVNSRQQGRWMYYSINLPQFTLLESYLTDFRSCCHVRASPCNES